MKFVRVLHVAFLVFVVLQICLVVQPFGNRVMAAGGDLLWEQQLGIGLHTYPLQIMIDGQQLIVVGAATVLPDHCCPKVDIKLFVAAYDLSAGTGGLVWSDTVGEIGGVGAPVINPAGLVVSGQGIFVIRHSFGESDPDGTSLRKYDRLHGTRLWEQVVYGGASGTWVRPSGLTATRGKLFVSGTTGPFEDVYHELNPQAFTRAYNGANGHVIWSSRSPVGSAGGVSFASGNQVFVVLKQGNSQFLRSYNAVTGAKLWERMIDPKKSVGPMMVNGNQLFLAGSTNTGGNYGNDYVVQSDRIDTGALLWENTLKNPGNDWVNDLAVAGQKVFIAGAQTNAAGSQDFMVKAFDALTGRLVWKNLVDKGGADYASKITANSRLGMVFAVGTGGVDPLDNPNPTGHGVVRAYNMNTGALAWESFIDDGSGFSEYASQVVVAGEKLFVVRGTRSFSFEDEVSIGSILIRAYAAK